MSEDRPAYNGTDRAAAAPIPSAVLSAITALVQQHGTVNVELDFKDGVLINARYREFWRKVNGQAALVNGDT